MSSWTESICYLGSIVAVCLQARRQLPDLKYKPTQGPMRTMMDISKMCVLTPEGDYYCVAIPDENYVYMVYTTNNGKLTV